MIGGLQGEFGDLDIKYLKQNISKCRSHIWESFRRTPRHCAKWLRNSPDECYQRIRTCLTGQNSGSEISGEGGMLACTRCRDPSPWWHGARIVIRRNSIRIPQEDTRRHAIGSNSIRIPSGGHAPPCYPDLLMEKDFKASVLHVSELSIALPWISKNSP